MLSKTNQNKIAICLLLIALLQGPLTAYAEGEETEAEGRAPGQMRINSEVISDTREEVEHQSFIGFTIAPHLFLEEQREKEIAHASSIRAFVNDTRAQAFLTENVSDKFDTTIVTSSLFLEVEERTGTHLAPMATISIMPFIPTWLWIIIGITGAALLGYVGILIGIKVAHLIYREKEGELNV